MHTQNIPAFIQLNLCHSKATIDLLEQDFAHFGYLHALVIRQCFNIFIKRIQNMVQRTWEITHLTGAPYHTAINGAAEQLIQTFKQALQKSRLPVKKALQEFLMQYRRTPTANGYSPSELLNGRQI